jgi:hypothetical protein
MGPAAARRIEILNYALGGLAVVVSLFVLSQPEILGLLCGALLGALNFSAIRRLVEKQIVAQKASSGGGGAGAALIFPKMIALIGAVAAAVFFLPIAPIFLAVGFSIFLVSIAIESVRFMTSRGKE